ncbi:hypothetical protein [Streptomyces sp. NPDC101455]|uniref:hypothetical protein n=1 Tax=Streptomyces sp. NPDC101455 TaxID=3366142 RepID=UPI0037F462EB
MAGWAPAERLFGLWVDFGHCTKSGRWLRSPAARFTCRRGCHFMAAGAEDVARFTVRVDTHHARICPGPPLEDQM